MRNEDKLNMICSKLLLIDDFFFDTDIIYD